MKQYIIERKIFSFLILYSCIVPFASSQTNWLSQPFEQKAFIENKGQFDNPLKNLFDNNSNSVERIFYGTTSSGINIYFSATGLIYMHEEIVPMNEEEKETYLKEHPDAKTKDEEFGENALVKSVPRYLKMEWLNANTNVEIINSDPVSFYYTYGGPGKDIHSTIKANAFRKIIYKNLYPNVDVEYIFPKDSSGIKYTLILHPGANPADIKMRYKNAENILLEKNGNLIIETALGEFVDHAPVSFYSNDNSEIPSSFIIKNNTVSFSLSINKTTQQGDIIIDPWTTNPAYTGFNSAYDVNFDKAGNVYALGSYNPYQLVKFNSAGVIQWTYTANGWGTVIGASLSYGDFAVDEVSGSSYLVEGLNSSGARIFKVNAQGMQAGTFAGNANMEEMWRAEYNRCMNTIVVAGGGHINNQAAIIDTTLATLTPVNVLGAPANDIYHDMSLLAVDLNANFVYMCTARGGGQNTYNNIILKCPTPGLVPVTYTTSNWTHNHKFKELKSLNYINNYTTNNVPASLVPGNAMNGMAVSPNWLYTYNGDTLKRWDKNTGALSTAIDISPLPEIIAFGWIQIKWGGLAVDECDNIYIGFANTIQHYNSSLTLVNTYNLTDTVYDIKMGINNKLYACGRNFVTEIDLAPKISVMTSTPPSACSACDGTATVTPPCPGPVTYSWNTNPIQTTQTATNLCPGTYIVTMTTSCYNTFYDTVTIIGFNSPTLSIVSQTNITCNGGNNGAAVVTSTGGTLPYSYSWSTNPVQTDTSITNLIAGSYACTVTDSNGCIDTVIVTITQPTVISGTFVTNNVSCNGLCDGTTSVTGSGGTPGYTYSWNTNPPQNTAAITGLCPNTYTVTITDNNACSNTATVTITQPTVLTANANSTNVLCNAENTGSATATGSGGTPSYSYAWNTVPAQNALNATTLTAGSYTCTITDANGCTATTTVNITEPTAISLTTSFIPGPCDRNNTANVIATGGTGAYTYLWNSTPPQNTATAINVPTGTFTVTVTDANGCTQTQILNILNNAITPTPGFTVDPKSGTIINNPLFTITDNSQNGNVWFWDFGDGFTSTLQNPTHRYADTGTYCIKQIVTNMPSACVDSAEHCVRVEMDWTFYVPNAFTPDGDGLNDLFIGKGTGILSYKMLIFDRWGNMIFESTNLNTGWEGKANGGKEIAQQDVYVYVIYITDFKKREHKFIGHFTLIK